MQCQKKKRDGKQCRAPALSDKEYCSLHAEPGRAKELGRKGGRRRTVYRPDALKEFAAPRTAAGDDIGPGPGLAFVLLLFSPLFAMMQFGMMASAMGVLALGYALYQAWKQTDGQGMLLDLSGPFRVGQGPIAAR